MHVNIIDHTWPYLLLLLLNNALPINNHDCEHQPFIGISFDDDEDESTIGAPPAKKMKISSQSTDTDLDTNNGKLIVV